MTREVAKRVLKSLDYYLQNRFEDYGERNHDAMIMAIKALEQGTDLEVYLEPTIINAPTIIESNKFSNNELENPFNDSRFGG